MSLATPWTRERLPGEQPRQVMAHFETGLGGVAAVVRHQQTLRLLVAADVGRAAEMLTQCFSTTARGGATLDLIASALDDEVTSLAIPGVCATLVEAGPDGFSVLHRGGPAPVLVGTDSSLKRVVPVVPGPPLGPHQSVLAARQAEFVTALSDDVLVVTTPGSTELAIRAMATAQPTLDGLRIAMSALVLEPGSAYAVVSHAGRRILDLT